MKARLPMALYSIHIATGAVTIIHRSTDWLNHVQFSPTDPTDGGGPDSVAAPGNGQWIYPFRPGPAGLTATPRVDLGRQDYSLEPNATFTPDGRWLVFRSNMHGASHVYAVEVP